MLHTTVENRFFSNEYELDRFRFILIGQQKKGFEQAELESFVSRVRASKFFFFKNHNCWVILMRQPFPG
jgi:hypothetical protein